MLLSAVSLHTEGMTFVLEVVQEGLANTHSVPLVLLIHEGSHCCETSLESWVCNALTEGRIAEQCTTRIVAYLR